MCGIIAYRGFRNSQEVLLKGLETIQYRGYDSMGMLLCSDELISKDLHIPSEKKSLGKLKPQYFKCHRHKIVRSVGDIQQLKKKLAKDKKNSLPSLAKTQKPHVVISAGMAHSRWATHGPVLEKNTHPHKAGPFYIVHNGIIENAEALKVGLKDPFLSDTDSEVVAHLVWDSYSQAKKLGPSSIKKAIFNTLSKIKGEYAVLLMSEEHIGEIWAFKKGPSLLIGVGEKEVFVCSDIQGVLPWTNKVIFLQDGEVAHISRKNQIRIYSKEQKAVKKNFVFLDPKAEQAKRGDWPCYMLKEIHDQPSCISKLIQAWSGLGHLQFPNEPAVDTQKSPDSFKTSIKDKKTSLPYSFLDRIVQAGRLNIVACGSSYYSALFGKYAIEQISQVFVQADMGSEFRYRLPAQVSGTPLLLISQSGETADTLSVLKMAQKQDWPVLSLCNVPHSSLERGAFQRLSMMAGAERAVASTKSFSATLTVLLLLSLCIAKHKGLLSKKAEERWIKELKDLPKHIKQLLSVQQEYKAVIQMLRSLKSSIYVGRNIYYPLALEGALKIKELTYRHAEAYPAGELKHGPLALVDSNMAIVGIAPKSPIYQKTLSNLEEARCRGGKLIAIGTKKDHKLKALSDCFISLPPVNEYLSAILCALPLQLMAYGTACALGHNVDQPRNLAKSVTVE